MKALPPLDPHSIRLIPLGGLGEIGMNCLAIEQVDGVLVIDCGTSFPHDDLGVDVIHPDFSWLVENASRVAGVFLTHGHEDHVGGLPYLLADLAVPVWGPPHAIGLARQRLNEHELGDADLRTAEAGRSYGVGPFEIEPVRVTHSIVEASALRIRTRAGVILHTGDFNLDPDPPDGEPTDEERLRQIGDETVNLLLSDSTNIDVADRPGSERAVGAALERLVSKATARVFVVMFASNVQRLMLLGDIAQRAGRKLCLLGRSLNTQVEIARRIRRLDWPSDLVISADQARTFPRDELLVLAGGSQAERNSAMRRIAGGTYPYMEIEAGDDVILSSRIIPGNERGVFEMMADLLRRGVHLHSRISDPDVHTSGHAGRSEQLRMLELTRPRAFLPVHGTLHHLLRHAELARSWGVAETLVIENGRVARFDGASLVDEGQVPHGKVAVAIGGEPMTEEALRRRAELGRAGLITVALAVDDRLELLAPPELRARGVPGIDDEPRATRQLAAEIARRIERVRTQRNADIEEEVRRAIRRRVFDLCGGRPVVEVQLVRLPGEVAR
ncbi:MAG TPA: ribonuclease J [Polyangiaceae bacterium]|nr:ribonuclease J [Polyangiaceae bacterium]